MIAYRPDPSFHDQVIKIAASYITKYKVYTNPGSEKNASLGNLYPDIILTDKNTNTVVFTIEVETAESVTESEADQWKQFSNLGGTFYLMVPQNQRAEAERICKKYLIPVKYATYWVENGQLKLNYE